MMEDDHDNRRGLCQRYGEVVAVSPAERGTRGLERIIQPAMSTVANAFWLVIVDVVRNFDRFGNRSQQRSEMIGSQQHAFNDLSQNNQHSPKFEDSRSYIKPTNIDTVKMNVTGWLRPAASEKEMDATMAKPTMDCQPPPVPKRNSVSSQSWTAWTSSSSWLQPNNNSYSSDNLSPTCKLPVRTSIGNAKMKVLHLAIVKNVTRPAVDLCAESDLSSYSRFMRGR
jgi:hypothetical protein